MSVLDVSRPTITIERLQTKIGAESGLSRWFEITQARIDAFAEVTEDWQFIHVDPVAAKATPFGGTIAHGYLTLSLVAPILSELVDVTDAKMGLNYGLDRVRFPAPLPVGARWRGGAELADATEIPGGQQMKLKVTVEVEGAEKPAMVAEALVRLYG